MTPYYETELGKLYHGDCLEIIPMLDPVDHIITDVPYGANTHKNAQSKDAAHASGGYRQGGYKLITYDALRDSEFEAMFRAFLSITKRWVVSTCDHFHVHLIEPWDAFVRLGAWVKIAPMPQLSGDRPGQGHEAVVILHGPGEKKWNRGGGAGVWTHTVIKNPKESFMPGQKPLSLIADFVSDFTLEWDTVLDPCFGAGTTAVICERLNRHWIGIEIAEEHCEISAKRIENETRQLKLF